MRPLFLDEQRLDMCRVVDPAVAIVGPAVTSHLESALENPHRGLGSDQAQGTADQVGRDRVVVEVEADEVGLEGMGRQREQVRGLFKEGLGHGPTVVSGPAAIPSHFVPPHERLAVQVIERRERPSREERVAYVPHAPLDRTLLVASRRPARPRREVVVRRQLEQTEIEAHGIPVPFADRRAQVVVEQMTRDPLKVRECVHVPAQEVLHRLIEEKPQEDPSRIRERQDEGGERSARGADHDVAEAGPIHLGLLRRKCPTPQEGLARSRTQLRHLVPHLAHAQRGASSRGAADTSPASRGQSPRTGRIGSAGEPARLATPPRALVLPSRGVVPAPLQSCPPASARRGAGAGSGPRSRDRSR